MSAFGISAARAWFYDYVYTCIFMTKMFKVFLLNLVISKPGNGLTNKILINN